MAEGQSLAPVPARSLQDIQARFRPEQFQLLVPETHMAGLPVGIVPMVTIVRLDPNPNHGDVFSIEGKKSPTKNALNRIAAAAGITWTDSRRVDDRRHPHYCEWVVEAEMTLPDGTVRQERSSRTIDLRHDAGDGLVGADAVGMKERALSQTRKFIQEHAESKAKNRAIRALLGLKTSYTDAELAKPFAVAKLVPDPSNEFAQKAVMARVLGAENALFGPALPPPPVEDVVDAEFHETPETSDPSSGEGGGEVLADSPPPVSGPPPMSAPTPLTPEQRQAEVNRLWNLATQVGVSEDFVELVRATTGRNDYGELDASDMKKLEAAIRAAGGAA